MTTCTCTTDPDEDEAGFDPACPVHGDGELDPGEYEERRELDRRTTLKVNGRDVSIGEARRVLGIPDGECFGCYLGDAAPQMHDLPSACEFADGTAYVYTLPVERSRVTVLVHLNLDVYVGVAPYVTDTAEAIAKAAALVPEQLRDAIADVDILDVEEVDG